MNWWVDLWGGFGNWWQTIDWGNAPAWAGAILSSVSVFLAFFIILRDRKNKRRELADSFVSFVRYNMNMSDENPRYDLEVWLQNTGSSIIPRTTLLARKENGKLDLVGISQDGDVPGVPPGQVAVYRVSLHEVSVSSPLIIHFKDGRNQAWFRDVKTNKYIRGRSLFGRGGIPPVYL